MPTVWRMVVKTSFPGGSTAGTNTWHFQTTGTAFSTQPAAVTAIKAFYDGIKANFGLTYKWTWDGTAAQVGQVNPTFNAPIAGWTVQGSSGGATDSGPAGVGMVVTWRSLLGSKSGRGRTFLAPLPSNFWQTDGTIVDTALTSVRTAAAALCTSSLSGGDDAVVVWSQKNASANKFFSSTVNDRVAFLSSRRS